jgi:ADP-heptose:LPS heptosyltransferase
MELAKYADGVVTIDSSLMHLAIANCKKMVVVWGQTSVKSFGYRKAINIQLNDEDSFGGPSMTGVQLFPEVKFPEPDVVFKAFEEGTYKQ